MLGADEKQCPEAARPNNNAWAVPAHKGEGDTNREDCAELVGKWVRQKKKKKQERTYYQFILLASGRLHLSDTGRDERAGQSG